MHRGVEHFVDVNFDRRAKTQKARWNSDQSESEEESSSDDQSVPDQSEKATSPRRSSSVPASETGQESNKEEDGGEPSEREKKFGRKARVKAQVSHVPARSNAALMTCGRKEKMSKQVKKGTTRPRKS